MITKHDLLEAIAECQGIRSPNANTAIKLAAFYTILDHLEEADSREPESVANVKNYGGYSFAGADAIQYDGDSEFAQAINGKPQSAVLSVMDELMTTIQVMNERLYNGVMRKLQ